METTLRRTPILLLTALLLASASTVGRATAQDAPPPAQVTVAAGGLVNPRGFAWDAEGRMVVAEAGTGSAAAEPSGGATGADEPAPPTPYRAGPTARVSRIDGGCPAAVAEGLPSVELVSGEPLGAADVALVGDRLVALVAGGGEAHGNPDTPAGLYDVGAGGPTLLVDLGAWLRENPVAAPPPIDPDAEGDWYSMVAAPDGAAVYVAERNGEQVLRVGLDGEVGRVVDLSAADAVPTALAVAPDGALHVGHFTAAPHPGGSAFVLKVSPDGTTETVWSGLTMVSGLAFGPDGALYATEFSSARERPPFFVAATGRVVRRTGPDSAEEVLGQLNFPTATRFGPDGALYVSLPAVGADDGGGIVVRADLSGGVPLEAQAFDLTAPACLPGGGENATRVTIFDFGFDASALVVTAGTTVTWVNTGSMDHTSVSFEGAGMAWDSGVLAPGAEYSFTFDQVGTYAYVCALHPDQMQGTVEVVASGP